MRASAVFSIEKLGGYIRASIDKISESLESEKKPISKQHGQCKAVVWPSINRIETMNVLSMPTTRRFWTCSRPHISERIYREGKSQSRHPAKAG
jgi:hypothetical protein